MLANARKDHSSPLIGQICLNMCFFVLFSCLLLRRLAVRICLPICIFFKLLLYRSSLQLGDTASQRFVAVDLLIFHISSYSNSPASKDLAYIVPSSTRCAGNLNCKDRIVKVRFNSNGQVWNFMAKHRRRYPMESPVLVIMSYASWNLRPVIALVQWRKAVVRGL